MPETYKTLGQQNPAATTLTALYTVPGSTQTIVSSISACNRHATNTAKIRVSIAVGGAADSLEQYLCYDLPLTAGNVWSYEGGRGMQATDVIRVYTDNATVSFSASGVEIT